MRNLIALPYVLCAVSLLATTVVFAETSQVSNLEDQVLSGAPASSPSVTNSAPTSKEDLSVPELSDEDAKPKAREKDLKKIDEAVKGPDQVPFEHILVVQNRFIEKEGAHEIAPVLIGIQGGDSFRRQIQIGFSYSYHFSEAWGVEVLHAGFITNFNTGLSEHIKSASGLETDRVEPALHLGSAVMWTPLKSKAATFDSIYHFEGFFLAGGGMTKTGTDIVPMAMYGIGFRSFLAKRAILHTELRDYMDFDSPTNHRLSFIVGASVLWGGGR